MNKTTVVVGSVTYAVKLKKMLARAGIKSAVVKLDNSPKNGGCIHGVSFNEVDFYAAVVIMRENNFEYSLYKETK